MATLDYYINRFRKMNRNRKDGEVAPHKSMLLIAVMDEIACGYLTNGFVPVNDRMITAFEATWRKFVGHHAHYQCRFTYPFYHLASEDWWKLMKTDTYVEHKEYTSTKSLRESFYGAFIPTDLWELMENESTRLALKMALLATLKPNQFSQDVRFNIAAEALAWYGFTKSESDNLKMAS